MAGVKNIRHVLMYKDPARYVNQACLALLRSGQLVVVFNEDRGREHRDDGHCSLIRSDDGGESWDASSKVTVLGCSDTIGNWDPAITQLSDGTLIVNTCQRMMGQEATYLYETWMGTFVLKSTDDGHSWTDPIPVNVRPMKHGGTRTPVLELPDGTLLMGIYGRMTEYGEWPYNDYETSRAYLAISTDGGNLWRRHSTLAYDPAHFLAFQEPALLRLGDSTLLCMVRCHTIPDREFDRLYMSFSEDDGFSWTAPKRTNIWGYPPELTQLKDGRVLLTYGYRREPGGVRGCVSKDGRTWDVANEFTIVEGGQHKIAGWHIGYPSTAQLEDGTIVTAYHQFSEDEKPVQHIQCSLYELAPPAPSAPLK